MRVENEVSLNQLQATLNAIPGNHIVLLPDAPTYTIIGATDSFLEISYTVREQLIGKPLFDVFPDNTTNEKATGVSNVRASLDQVVAQKKAHQMADQRYDIINPTTGAYEFKVWTASNKPVLNADGTVQCIIHTTEDITDKVRLLKENAVKEERLLENEGRFRRMVEQAPMPMLLSRGEDIVIERINEPMLRFMNKTSFDEVLGKKMIEVLPELKDQEVLQIVKNVQKTGISFRGEEQPVDLVVNDQIKRQYFDFSYTPIIEAGQITGVLHVAVDITQQVEARKKVEEANRQIEIQKRLYETVTNNTPDLIYVFDLSCRFTYANKALLDMWGKTWEQSIGKGLRENGYEEWHAQMHEREVDQVAATKNAVRGEVSFPHAALGKRVYDYILVPVLNEKGEVEAVAGTTRDITEHKLSEQAIIESNERFRNLADDSPLFVFIIDADPMAPVSYWNKTWLQFTGQTYEEALGRAWNGIIHPDDIPIVMEHYAPAFQAKQPYFIPAVRVKRHDGEYRWHAFKGNPRYSATGAFNGYVGVGFDVHDQKLAEEALKQSESTLRNMIISAPIAIAILRSKDYVVEIVNKHALEFWGRTYDEVINRPLFDCLPELSTQGFREFFDGIYDSGVPIHLKEHPITFMRNGRMEDFYFNFLYEVLYDAHGKVNGLMAIGVDVTLQTMTRMKIEEAVAERTKELAIANEDLKRSNQNLEEFAYAASHDLKEPIRKIHFFSDRIKERLAGKLEEEDRRYFERMESGTKRMTTLIDDLLLYSHVSRGIRSEETVDLNQTLSFVLDDLELNIEEKGAKVIIGHLPTIKGQPRQLQQLFENLVANALKYGKPDIAPEVHITAQTVHGKDTTLQISGESGDKLYHLIAVQDNGIGFNPKDADRIFNVFTRLHGNTEYKGTGVGLSIARKVVENHHGYIWAESQPGEGATFNVLLPVEVKS